jgi:Domain of unknown function (DUF4350)
MPKGLDAADRKLLIGAGVVLLATVIASAVLSPPKAAGGASFPSTYSAAWEGAKAAYLLLQDSGYQVERWENSPAEISGDADHEVLILAEPVVTAGKDDQKAVRDFLSRGGRVLATGSSAWRLLPDAADFDEGESTDEQTRFPAVLPSPIVSGAPEISLIAPEGWKPKGPGQVVLYGNDQTAAVVSYSVGRGKVIWWGGNTPLTNSGIRESNNLALFLNSVGAPAGTRVLWDEYFHGAQGSIWMYFRQTPVPWAMAQLGLVFLVIIATFSRRHGPVRMPEQPSRLSPLEFVDTLGDLYTAGHAGSAAVRVVYQRLRFLLTRQLGLPGNLSAEELSEHASESLAWRQGPLLDTLKRAESWSGMSKTKDAESLALVQELFDYTARLTLRRVPNQEGQPE